MTKDEIKTLIAEKISGQGNQVDIGGALADILNALADASGGPLAINTEDEGGFYIDYDTFLRISRATSITVNGKNAFNIMNQVSNLPEALLEELDSRAGQVMKEGRELSKIYRIFVDTAYWPDGSCDMEGYFLAGDDNGEDFISYFFYEN